MIDQFLDLQLYESLQKSQYWNADSINYYQLQELKKLLQHAFNHVPYYNKLFSDIGFFPNDVNQISDIRHIPFLYNKIITKNLDRMLATNYNIKELSSVKTGGTTGVPLVFYRKKDDSYRENAFVYTMWSRKGIRPYDKCVVLTGRAFSDNNRYKFNKKLIHYGFLVPTTLMKIATKILR